MVQKLLQLYVTLENGEAKYRLGYNALPDARVLDTFNSIYDIADYGVIPDQNGVVSSDVNINGILGSSTQYYTRTLSEDGRKRISASSSESQKGAGNSQFGTRWIHSLKKKKSKKIRATDPLPNGWIEGRKIKFKDEITYCSCCGAERVNGVGECYTDCMFYEGNEGNELRDSNPH